MQIWPPKPGALSGGNLGLSSLEGWKFSFGYDTPPLGFVGYCGRKGRKNSAISRAKASGCSIAAKWPPFGIAVH